MKKILLLFICLMIPLGAQANKFMEKCMKSWVGYPLDSAIKKWGYPDKEQTIAGRKLYTWEMSFTTTSSPEQHDEYKEDSRGNTYTDTYYTPGDVHNWYCARILETDSKNTIINYDYKGNGCPAWYWTGKHWINPENNYKENQKQQKKQQREARKKEKALQKEAKAEQKP